MNRDGFRAGRRVAEHEAAHAVIGTLSGCVVRRVSISPSRAERDRRTDGWADIDIPQVPWPVPLSPTAEIDVKAAGLAWELLTWRSARWSWQASAGDREGNSLPAFLAAVARVRWTLRRPPIAAAVAEVADAIQARKSGEIYGTTVDKIVSLHVTSFAHQQEFSTRRAHNLDAASLTADLGAGDALIAGSASGIQITAASGVSVQGGDRR